MSTFKRFLVASDNHGQLGCPKALAKLMQFDAEWKPHYRIHLGDLWDFAPLRGGATPEEKAEGIADDLKAGLEFLDAFKPQFLTLGNHDDRLWRLRDCGEGVIRERAIDLVEAAGREFKKRRITWVPYKVNAFLQLPEGGPKLIHGFRSTLYPAKAHWDNWGACLHGHVHKPDQYVARHVDGSTAYSVGCMADLEQLTYADRTPAKLGWRQGFLHGIINSKTGDWKAWHTTNENGNWVGPLGLL